LITSSAYVVTKGRDQFGTKATRPKETWQTDFICFKVIGWRRMWPSTVLYTSLTGDSALACRPMM
jgi:hypothetical protein